MARYAGSTIEVISFATKTDGDALVAADVDSATATVYDGNGSELSTGSMSWDSDRVVWVYEWDSPSDLPTVEFFAKCVLVSTSLNFTSTEYRTFSIRPSPVPAP